MRPYTTSFDTINVPNIVQTYNIYTLPKAGRAMGKRATGKDIERWRHHYWLLREKFSNKEIAERLGVDPANLSALASGIKTPGEKFIKDFYMEYPEFKDSPKENAASSKEERPDYKQEPQPSPTAEEAVVRQFNAEDTATMRIELYHLRRNEEFLRNEFSKVTSTSQTAVNAFDKMAESNLTLSRAIAFYRKQANTNQKNASPKK